ncbi:MAG: tetratricopeptide repeat protein [Gemmatimonadota bacterium]|nr:tetratricopeptide repeat protein [Gemmatimonadota bacterium]
MAAFKKLLLVPTALSAALVTGSGAQAAQPAAQRACQIDENSGQLGKALLSISLAQTNQQAQKWPDAANHLRNAVKALEKPDKKNELGQRLVLGKALTLWMNQPDIGLTPTRGTLGFGTSPDARIDLIAAIDSNFSQIEAVNAACENETAPWRAQKPWLTMVNQAIEAINTGNVDTAEALANRSLRLYRKAPYAYMVLASAAQNRGETTKALQYHQQTIEAATDTSFAEARRQALLTLANLAADVADTASGATKAQFAREARSAYERLIGEAPNSPLAPQARGGLSRVLLIAGDTAAFRTSYRDQIENPNKYDYRDILASAVSAARSQQWADAAGLFENVSKLNPYNRDALYNLAVTYHELGQYEKMVPYLHRLVAVDPGNADNWLLLARAYNGLGKAAQKAKNTALHKAYNDSTVKYYQLSEKLPVNVIFTEFTTGEAKSTLAGTIENRTDAEKSYNLRFEFLDKAGNVVGTKEVAVGPVAAKAKSRFTTTIDGQNIAAFRYAAP